MADPQPWVEPTNLVAVADQVQNLDQLSELLRQLRRRHARGHSTTPLTVRELASRSGYAHGAVGEYLSGRILPPIDRFDVLIRLLGAGPAEQRALATARDRVEERRRTAGAARLVPRELPPSAPGFVGRSPELAALDRLRRRRGRGRGEVPVAVIAGTAGVGKTALALHWARRAAGGFPDGCLYLDLRGYHPERPVPPADALAWLLRSLGVAGAELPPTEAERAAHYRTLLADRRVLVVLDNARDGEHVWPLVPGGAGCAVLVTSRDALAGLAARLGASRIDLAPLPGADAVALLSGLVGTRVAAEPEAAGTLADQCAGLPLILRLVAQLASARPEVSLAALAGELSGVRQRLDLLDGTGDPRTAVRAAFSWSYHHLTGETARAFRLCGLHPVPELDAYAMAALAGTDLDRGQRLLQALAAASLVQRVGPRRYGMHDLLHAYAAELAAGDPEPACRAAIDRLRSQQLAACARAMDLVVPADPGQRPEVAEPDLPVPRFAGAREAAGWLDSELPAVIAAALAPAGPAGGGHAGQLGALLRQYLDQCGHYRDSGLLFGHAAAIASDPAGRAHALVGLGGASWRLGRYQEAAGHLERALQLARRAGDRVAEGQALHGLGVVYWHLGRPDQTLQCGQQALRLHRALGDRAGQARTVGNLGCVHNLLGDFRSALAHHRQALALFRELDDPSGVAAELSNLGSDLTTLGQLTGAQEHLQAALGMVRSSGFRTSEITVLDNLGTLYRQLGQLAEARDHHECAVALARAICDRRAEGYALGRLGTVHERLGRLDRAVHYHHQGLRIGHAIGDHHLVAELRNRLGETLLAWPRPKQALRFHRQALTRTSQHGYRYELARAHHGIGRALTLAGDPAASWHQERARQLCVQLGVPPLER